jgi:hypothetical protein
MSRSFLTNLNLNKNQLLNAAIQPLSQAPQNPVQGQIYFDTGINALRQWTGTEWIDYLSSADGNQFIESVGSNLDVTNQQLTLGEKVVITDASQTLTNKELGSGTTLGANLSGVDTYTVTNLVNPTNPQDAATKSYVDATAQGLSVLGSVRAASGVDIVIADTNLAVGGVTLADGDRVLVKAQDDATENGIYIFNGTTGKLVASTTPSDVDIKEGSYTLVEEGTYATQGWIVTALSAGASTWTQFSAAGEYLAGTAIDLSNNTISVKLGTGLTTDGSGNITFASGYGVQKYHNTNPSLTAVDGQVTWNVEHMLGTSNVQVAVYQGLNPVEVDVMVWNANTVVLSWVSGDVTAGDFSVVVIG